MSSHYYLHLPITLQKTHRKPPGPILNGSSIATVTLLPVISGSSKNVIKMDWYKQSSRSPRLMKRDSKLSSPDDVAFAAAHILDDVSVSVVRLWFNGGPSGSKPSSCVFNTALKRSAFSIW